MMHDQSAVCASAQTAPKTMTPRQLSQLCLGHDPLTLPAPRKQDHLRVHIAALGDVGASLLLGLRLLGGALKDVRRERSDTSTLREIAVFSESDVFR